MKTIVYNRSGKKMAFHHKCFEKHYVNISFLIAGRTDLLGLFSFPNFWLTVPSQFWFVDGVEVKIKL